VFLAIYALKLLRAPKTAAQPVGAALARR